MEDDDDEYEDVILDFHVGYRRPTVVECTKDCNHPKDELSDYVVFRLWLARQLALEKYREQQKRS